MALEVQRKQPEIKRPETKDLRAPVTPKKTDDGKPASTSTGTPASTATSTTADTQRSQPTLQTSLDSRKRFGADSGTAQRSFLLNRQLDGATAPATTDKAPRTRALRLVDDGGSPTAAAPAEPADPKPPEVKTGEQAIAVLDRDFDKFDTADRGGDTDGKVGENDLRAVAENKGGNFTEEQRQAAQVLLDSKTYRSFVDVGAGRGSVDGTISRDDVKGAQDAIKSGTYQDELLDTANGRGGRDNNVGQEDVQAALNDPAVPQETKDAINLMLKGSDGTNHLHGALSGLTTSEISDASKLVQSPQYGSLSDADKKLAADAFRDSGGDSAVTKELKTTIESSKSAEEKSAALARTAVLNSSEYKALPAADQELVRQTMDNAKAGDLQVPGSMKSLLEDPNFQRLSAAEKNSILSQTRNYPDSRAIKNLDRMVDKDWFQDQSTEDKQRSTKLVAHMSADENGDRTVIDNTLNRFLSPDSDYKLEWESIAAEGGNVTFGHASGDTLTLNRNLVPADNNRVQPGNETHVIENTTAHEVSHLVNGDSTNQTFEYLNEEYRAWYVGYQAEHGRPPSNQEAMDRWEYFLNPDGGYADYSHGTDAGWPFGIGDKDGALDKSEEAEKIYGLLSELSGLEVTADNYQDVMADPSKWKTKPGDPASSSVFPDSDDLDN